MAQRTITPPSPRTERPRRRGGEARTPTEPEGVDIPALIGFVRRRMLLIALAVVASLVIGSLYAFTSQPRYTAVASLLIDDASRGLSEQIGPGGARAAEDVIGIETQMQIIRSQRVALSVVDQLALVDDPRFVAPQPDVISAALGGLRQSIREVVDMVSSLGEDVALEGEGGEPEVVRSPREAAAMLLRNGVTVRRVGASRTLDVSYTGTDPVLAAAIANALTTAYVEDRLLAQFEATDNAGIWLRERIADLQSQFAQTAQRVQAFRADHDIIDTGGGRGLVNEEALAEVNRRLVEAAADAYEARARHAEIQRIIVRGDFDAELVDAGGSTLIDTLRARRIETADQLARLETRLAPDNPAIVSAREELARTNDAIRSELLRIADRLRTAADIATQREAALRAELDRLIQQANITGEARVRLQQLESEAEVLQAAYESHLQRYTDIIQRQSAPFLDARTISPAMTPRGPSAPQRVLVLALSLVLGAGIGLAGAVAVEAFDRTIRLPRDLARIGLSPLGVVPMVGPTGKAFRRQRIPGIRELGFAADQPNSPFARSLRRAKAELALALADVRGGAVIGVTALSAGEGTTTIASNLGQLFARGGQRTLLVDANAHASTLSSALDAEGDNGESALAMRRLTVLRSADLLERLRDPHDNDPDPQANASDLVSAERLRHFLDEARGQFEVIVLDLPALESVADTNVVAPFVDALMLVVEWGRTPSDALEGAAGTLARHDAPIAGALINKARVRQMRALGYRPLDQGYAAEPPKRPPARAA